jgi:hypothetical protein
MAEKLEVIIVSKKKERKEKKHGWVLDPSDSDGYVDDLYNNDVLIEEAEVYLTRNIARKQAIDGDRIRKVRVENGIAMEVIKGR